MAEISASVNEEELSIINRDLYESGGNNANNTDTVNVSMDTDVETTNTSIQIDKCS